jgi:hypothetical protein
MSAFEYSNRDLDIDDAYIMLERLLESDGVLRNWV